MQLARAESGNGMRHPLNHAGPFRVIAGHRASLPTLYLATLSVDSGPVGGVSGKVPANRPDPWPPSDIVKGGAEAAIKRKFPAISFRLAVFAVVSRSEGGGVFPHYLPDRQ